MKYINIILILIVLGGTIGLFYLLGPETKTSLFYFNLVFACILEVILFGSVFKIAGDRLFTIPNVAIGYQISRAVIVLALIMVAYNLFGKSAIDPKWYFGALLLVSLIFLIVIIFTFQGASYQMNQAKDVKEKKGNALIIQAEFQKINSCFKSISNRSDIDYALLEEVRKTVGLLGDKVSAIPIAKLERFPEHVEKLKSNINLIYDDMVRLDGEIVNEEFEAALKLLSKKISQLSDSINLITNN